MTKAGAETRACRETLESVMPEMDGASVLNALREDPELAGIRVVMLTGAERNVVELPPGVDLLAKPVTRHRLLEVVGRHVVADRSSVSQPTGDRHLQVRAGDSSISIPQR